MFECTLAQVYKRTDEDGTYRGGPAQSIVHGLGRQFNWLGIVYAISLIATTRCSIRRRSRIWDIDGGAWMLDEVVAAKPAAQPAA